MQVQFADLNYEFLVKSMYKRDYILRMVDMIAELIAGILGLIKKGDYQKASQSIENAYREYLKQDAAFFNAIEKDQLTEKLLKGHNYTNGHLEILSELFYAEAELLSARQKKACLDFYEKSFILLDFILHETKTFSLEKQSRMLYLQQRIEELKES